MSEKDQILKDKLPKHIAIIMDGNGRWAMQQGHMREFGHKNGVSAVRESVEACAELGVEYLTLYAFSTENWNRPKEEVDALMGLLVESISAEMDTLMNNNIRLRAIGDLQSLPGNCLAQLNSAMAQTAGNTRLNLVLALSYSARWELVKAVQSIAQKVESGQLTANDISEQIIENELCTSGFPNPELLIRTSGEHRISNFLLWQIAYAELYFTPVLWPDFSKKDLYQAIVDYQSRERRFGLTSAQLNA